MDPISALSLAANIIQVVDFGIDVIRGRKALYERGCRDEDGAIDAYALNIREACQTLQAALKQKQRSLGAPPTRLTKVTIDASAAADELRIELNKLKLSQSQGAQRAGQAFKIALTGLVKSGKIKKLQQRLELQHKALESSLITET
jgi:hypothetical protein